MKSTSKMTKALLGAGLILLLTFTLVASVAAGAQARDASEKASAVRASARRGFASIRSPSAGATRQRLIEAYAKLPLSFESNQGQTDGQVKFLSRGSGYTLFLTPTEAVLVLSKPQNKPSAVSHQPLAKPEETKRTSATVRIQLVGANPQPHIVGLEELPGKSNYFLGNDPTKWHRNVPNYTKVKYWQIYPGVDLFFYDSQRMLEYDFVVAPGADPGAIRLDFEGADKLSLDDEGNLVIHTSVGQVVQHAPIAYQPVNGVRRPVTVRHVLEDENRLAFQVDAYDRRQPLVIDPIFDFSKLEYSTYLGGSGSDFAHDIAVDADLNAYVTGWTNSTDFPKDFPQVAPLGPTTGGGAFNLDAFVAKFNKAGTAFIYYTYLGSTFSDTAEGIAVDAAGNAYVIGNTPGIDFPIVNGFQTSVGLFTHAFVAKLDALGASILYSSFLSGSSGSVGEGIAVDAAGDMYVTGSAYSADFPKTTDVAPFGGITDVFVARFDATQSGAASLVYSTYLGGSSNDDGDSIAVDSSLLNWPDPTHPGGTVGHVYVTGTTQSTDFPGLSNLGPGGNSDAFVVKLNPVNPPASQLVYGTYLGGSGMDFGTDIAVDASGNAYVTGSTSSLDFPTQDAFQAAKGANGSDAFVTMLNAAGSATVYSTYLGGDDGDSGYGIAVDTFGSAYVTGVTKFTKFTQFPTTANVPQPTFNGGFEDAFVTKLGAYEKNNIQFGDVNGDGTVGAYDAVLVLQYVVGLRGASASLAFRFNMVQDSPQWKAADVSGNGKVTAYDAALILQHSVGLITEFPAR